MRKTYFTVGLLLSAALYSSAALAAHDPFLYYCIANNGPLDAFVTVNGATLFSSNTKIYFLSGNGDSDTVWVGYDKDFSHKYSVPVQVRDKDTVYAQDPTTGDASKPVVVPGDAVYCK
jgi:hypothetical protein